jgi:predicted ABC-type ATPase
LFTLNIENVSGGDKENQINHGEQHIKTRVLEGGHNIPNAVITRRYLSGLNNLFNLYIPICDYWMVFNNSKTPSELIAEGYSDKDLDIKNINTFDILKRLSQNDKKR